MKLEECENSILIFEYFTASGDRNPCIISEAESLILSLIDDLKDLDIVLLIHKSYEYLLEKFKNLKVIFIEEILEDWLKENSKYFKKAMFISAENDMNLYKLTKVLEDNNLKIYNSSKEASLTCSNKFLTYNKLKNIVHQPKTIQLNLKKESLSEIYNKWNKSKLIIKPINGVDCEDIKIINSLEDIPENLNLSEVLVQEFIEGEDISVSLISDGKNAIPISLNKQNIVYDGEKQKYLGGCLPYISEFKADAFKIAVTAVEAIEGIKGFVGVDLILDKNNKLYFLEINSRFTTPYVALSKIANFNIGENIIDLLDNKIGLNDLKKEISLSGNVTFKKEGNYLNLEINK